MRRFDESRLVAQLEQLPVAQRVASAAAAAMRQADNVGRAPGADSAVPELFRPTLEAVWQVVELGQGAPDWTAIKALLTRHMTDDARDHFPVWTVWHALSDDALASLVYAIRTVETGSAQEAAWAARRAYEAADQAAMRLLESRGELPDAEATLLAHPVVQRELRQQVADLADAGDPQALRLRATRSALLSAEDVSTLGGSSGG